MIIVDYLRRSKSEERDSAGIALEIVYASARKDGPYYVSISGNVESVTTALTQINL